MWRRRITAVLLLLFVLWLQFNALLGIVTYIVCAEGEGRPALPSKVAEDMPIYFFVVSITGMMVMNAFWSLCLGIWSRFWKK